MKTKTITLLQIICLCFVAVSVIGLGVEIFQGNMKNLTAVYLFGALGIAGLVGNALLAVCRVWKELKK